jgi:hypothetical protein
LERLEAQVAGLTHNMRQSNQVVDRLGTLERHVSRMTGSLENFLSRIQIEDRVRLVSDERRITSADQDEMDLDDITLQPVEIEIDVIDPLAMEEDDASGFLTPVPGTATTPSDSQEDVRMDEMRMEGMLAFHAPPLPPPPPPAVNVIPPTPQNSQEVVDHVASSTTPAATSLPAPPAPAAPGPALLADADADRSKPEAALALPDPAPLLPPPPATLLPPPPTVRRSRSRTPQPVAGPSRLSPAVGLMTRSRSRSQSKSPT